MALILMPRRLPPFRAILMQLACLLAAGSAQGADQATPIRTHAWPFIIPDPSTLRAMPRKVFAHYHTQFPRSFDNLPEKADYYSTQYLDPDGEDGRYSGCGGFLRDRPLPRDPLPGDWVAEDCRWEVESAAALGLDGFCVNLLEPDGVHLERALHLARAAAKFGKGFRIALMPDFAAGFGSHPEHFVTAVARFSQEPAAFRMADGRLVVMAFDAQRMSPSWWRQQKDLLAAAGIHIALVPCLQFLDQHRASFMPFCEGLGEWGLRTPAGVGGQPDRGEPLRAEGKLWMAPVAPQDYRPKDLLVMEAEGTTLFRTMWDKAINDKADWVQLVTWNDYSEHTHIAPSVGSGWVWYDLSAWYTTKFKTGREPVVIRDALHLVHRAHRLAASVPGARRARFDPPGSGKDIIEAVVWMASPGEVVCGGIRKSCPPGLSSVMLPPGTEFMEVRIERGGRVVESTSLRSIMPSQGFSREDLLYRSASGISGNRP